MLAGHSCCIAVSPCLFFWVHKVAPQIMIMSFFLQPGHAWLSQHYKWALDRVFLEKQHSHAIIVEDDMLFSPDFLHYFQATAVLLDRDPSLWCISTWNDNGLKTFDWDPARMVLLYTT